MNNTHQTRHTSELFGNLQNRMRQFTIDLRLFKTNTARDEGISANSQTQHWRTTITLTGSDVNARVNLVLFYKPCSNYYKMYVTKLKTII